MEVYFAGIGQPVIRNAARCPLYACSPSPFLSTLGKVRKNSLIRAVCFFQYNRLNLKGNGTYYNEDYTHKEQSKKPKR